MHPIRGGSTKLWHVQARIRSSPDAGEAAPRGHASMRGRGEEESRSLSWSLNQVYPSHRLRIGRALAAAAASQPAGERRAGKRGQEGEIGLQ